MKTFFQNNETYDIEIGADGQLKTVEGLDAYSQIISDALRTIKGEYIFDIELGIPYLKNFLGKKYGIDEWIAHIQNRVLSFSFVKSISSFEYSYDSNTKTVSYTMIIITDLGPLEVNQ